MIDSHELKMLEALEKKILWLSSWMIHNANHLRPKSDGLKVGGHQASSASLVTLMTALYCHILRPEDRVAVKPHASPVFHAIQYLLGNQSREKLETLSRGMKSRYYEPGPLAPDDFEGTIWDFLQYLARRLSSKAAL